MSVNTANADTFRANVQTTNPRGDKLFIQFELSYKVSADNSLSGKLKNFTVKGPCIRADGADIIEAIAFYNNALAYLASAIFLNAINKTLF